MTQRLRHDKLLRQMLMHAASSGSRLKSDLENQHGILYEMQGELEKAAKCFKSAQFGSIDGKFNFGRLLATNPQLRQGMPEDLPMALVQSAGFEGSFFAQFYLGHTFREQDLKTSSYWLEQASEKFLPAKRLYGCVLVQLGKIDEAMQLLVPLMRQGDPQVTAFINSMQSMIRARKQQQVKSAQRQAPRVDLAKHQQNVFMLRGPNKSANLDLKHASDLDSATVVVPIHSPSKLRS